jgi:type II secretion system protein J
MNAERGMRNAESQSDPRKFVPLTVDVVHVNPPYPPFAKGGKRGAQEDLCELRYPQRIKQEWLQNRRGFTLLEIMVACAILGLVVAALYGVFSRTLGSKRLAEERMANVRAARIALWRIGEDLQASFPLTGSLGFLGETRREGEFPQDSLSFVSAAHTLLTSRGAEGTLCQIGYTLMPDPQVSTQHQLVRRVQIDVRADQDASGEVAALLSHVRGLRFRFFDGQNWLEEWGKDKTQGTLPQAVEVTLYLGGPDARVAVFSTVVTLPLAGSRRFGVS